jgi:hypothetical protein
MCGLVVCGSGYGPVAGFREHCKETWCSVKGEEFFN